MLEASRSSPHLCRALLSGLTSLGIVLLAGQVPAAAQLAPDDAQAKARQIEAQMTDDERFGLIKNLMVVNFRTGRRDDRVPADVPQLAGWTPGVSRLGTPDLLLADASLGITNPGLGRLLPDGTPDSGTALPAGMAMGSTFDPELARAAGVLLGLEAKQRGFNIHLGGGINLARDPRNGRNFEYISEDPLLSGLMGGAAVAGTQSVNVMAMLKHVSLNSQETNKFRLDARIDPAAHREAEMLAFQIGIERGDPGSLMCGYNKINGEYSCGNQTLLVDVVKDALGFRGFVMSDWKAVYSWDYALKGIDMHSGAQLDEQEWFDGPLREAVARGDVPRERISDMCRHILYAIYVSGIDTWKGPQGEPDLEAHRAQVLQVARQGTVLLKNNGILPLETAGRKTVAVIGGYGNLGQVLGGGGSSLMEPTGGTTLNVKLGGEGAVQALPNLKLIAPGPVDAIRAAWPEANVIFDSGMYPKQAALLAARSDVVILNLIRYEGEGYDAPDMSLPNGQDQLADAVLAANPNGIVILQTGNPVDMPWRGKAAAIVQAWYQGHAGATAVAEILTGKVNPSGRLPVTWYANVEQTPHPVLIGKDIAPDSADITVNYHEGAEIGYRWLAKTGETPIYPFGHGLSYTSFAYSEFAVTGGESVTATFKVTNTSDRVGADVPQVYLVAAPGEVRQRLLGFERVELAPGETSEITVQADPRLLARFDGAAGQWRIEGGTHRIVLGKSATQVSASADVELKAQLFGK